MAITWKYQAGTVSGGYAFSANNEEITLSGYVQKLPELDQNIIKYEAEKARSNYVAAVKAKKKAGEKVNPLTIKRESVLAAKEATVKKFTEEEFNRVQEVVAQNRAGAQSVTGKSKPKADKKTSKPKKVNKVVDLDLEDLDTDIPELDMLDSDIPEEDESEDPFADDDDDEMI